MMFKTGIYFSVSSNGVIGDKEKLPWPPLDLETIQFNEVSKNKVLVVGSTTYLTHGFEDIKDVVVLSSMPSKITKGYSHILQGSPLNILAELYNLYPDKEILFIGGMSIFNQFSGLVNDMWITEIGVVSQGDVVLTDDFFSYVSTTFNKKSSVYGYEKNIQINKQHFERPIH